MLKIKQNLHFLTQKFTKFIKTKAKIQAFAKRREFSIKLNLRHRILDEKIIFVREGQEQQRSAEHTKIILSLKPSQPCEFFTQKNAKILF